MALNEKIGENEKFIELLKLLNLRLNEFTSEQKVARYKYSYVYKEHIRFKFFGSYSRELGGSVHSLELTGQGCREIEELGVEWITLFKYIYYNNIKATRIDIAMDVKEEMPFKLTDLVVKTMNFEYTSRTRKYGIHMGGEKSSETYTGTSLYYGTIGNDVLNIYDKKAERLAKNYISNIQYWTRFEIRLSDKKTGSFLKVIIDNGIDTLPTVYRGLLNEFVCYRVRGKSKDPRKHRWEGWEKWEELIGKLEGLKLEHQSKVESTIISKMDWHENSLSQSDLVIYASAPNKNIYFNVTLMLIKLNNLAIK